MSNKSIQGNTELAQAIKKRRIELNLTIEEAANKAGVGTKTWYRYESGESIRQDKCKGVCKALNWLNLPNMEEHFSVDIKKLKNNKYWSKIIEQEYGETAAVSFIIGSDILKDNIDYDLSLLSKMPIGTHLGELDFSFLEDMLPVQFLPQYNFDFIYKLRSNLIRIRSCIKNNRYPEVHSVLDEITYYLIVESSKEWLDGVNYLLSENWDDWIYDVFDDVDIYTFLYSDLYLSESDSYHFVNWDKNQFFME